MESRQNFRRTRFQNIPTEYMEIVPDKNLFLGSSHPISLYPMVVAEGLQNFADKLVVIVHEVRLIMRYRKR